MRKTILILSSIAAIAVPTLASASSCETRAEHRKIAGTVLGGLAGAVIGNQVSHHGGAVVGGIGGAVVGNQLSRTKCGGYAHRRVYTSAANERSGRTAGCTWRDQPFYDARGELVHQRVCR